MRTVKVHSGIRRQPAVCEHRAVSCAYQQQICARPGVLWQAGAVSAGAFEVSHDADAICVPELVKLFASAWWTSRRTEAETRAILAGSDVVVTIVERPVGRLVGFARALTDRAYLAVILDVMVAPEARGTGVGATLMDAVLRHPWVTNVKSVELVCQPDLVAFYRRWGFSDQVGQSRLMRRTGDSTLIG